MSGHNKWAQIKHKKATSDAKRGKLFSKLAREIAIASQLGSSMQETNPRLRAATDRAHSAGVPKQNIERAITRGTGDAKIYQWRSFSMKQPDRMD